MRFVKDGGARPRAPPSLYRAPLGCSRASAPGPFREDQRGRHRNCAGPRRRRWSGQAALKRVASTPFPDSAFNFTGMRAVVPRIVSHSDSSQFFT